MWVKPTAGTGTAMCPFMQSQAGTCCSGSYTYFSACVVTDGYGVWGYNNDRWVTDSTTSTRPDAAARGEFPDDEWHHLAFTWSGAPDNMLKVYYDGQRLGDTQHVLYCGSSKNDGPTGRPDCDILYNTSPNHAQFGGGFWRGQDKKLNGKAANLRVWNNYAVPEADVAAWMEIDNPAGGN